MVLGRKHRIEKRDWWSKTGTAQCRISARENCYLGVTISLNSKSTSRIKLRGKCFADLKECAETYPWMWERSYTVHWHSHILVWHWTSWQLNHLNGRKRWRSYKCRAEIYSKSAENSHWYWVQAETRMDHSGAKKKVSCTKDSTQASASTGLCLHAYLHHKFQYISDLRDRLTRGSSSGKLRLN